LPGFCESYPFDKSLDELPIGQWIADIASRNSDLEFTVVNYEYMNTGGNTMVGIHDVWLPEEKKTVYVYTNEEGCSIACVDYIRNALVYEDEFIIEHHDIGRLTGYEKYFELYRRCLNDYIKDDTKYFNKMSYSLPYYLLSDELQQQVSEEYLTWLEAERDGMIPVAKGRVLEDEYYVATIKESFEKKLQAVVDFKEWHNNLINKTTTDDELDELYSKEYTLTINGKSINLPFQADVFTMVNSLLDFVIKEW
jgi:hypothetical protein